ncbi:MAG: EcsC family protein [Paracoccaceae bacterium]|nr:MAG: EcsC family protein [Paracoccaceae bacterium]
MDTPAATALPAARPDPAPEIARLAARYRRANGPVMALMNRLGGQVEDQLSNLPPVWRDRIETATLAALSRAVMVAQLGRHAPRTGPAGAPVLAALTGAAGGAGGIATAIAELPLTITLILHAILREAAALGFDPDDPGIRAEALRVMAQGSPLASDDGINTALIGARLTLTGPAMHKLIATLAPGLAAVLTRKLAAQAVPVLGAVTGAALNTAFLRSYRDLAHVRFGLLRLAEIHGAGRVLGDFAQATTPPRLRRA